VTLAAASRVAIPHMAMQQVEIGGATAANEPWTPPEGFAAGPTLAIEA
jgi:hypothetical protein